MYVSRLAALAAIAWSFCAVAAQAQMNQPGGKPVSFDYYYYQTGQPSPSDQPAAPAQVAQAPVAQAPASCECQQSCQPSCEGGCSEFCNPCQGPCSSCINGWLCDHCSCWPCGCSLECLGEAHKCCQPCCEDDPWFGTGWIAQSFVWNPYNPSDRFNGPMTWTDRANDYQMNELFYYFGKTAKADCDCWDWGFRVDAMYGTNYRWNTSAGFETNWGSNRSFYGIAVPQLYGELAYGDASIKVGRFYSPVGYYVIGTANNFFPVLPYTFQYGEPFTHTGVFGTYKYSDELTLGLGLTHGWDSSDNTGNPYMGGLLTATWTINECSSLAYVGVFGNEPNVSGVNPRVAPGAINNGIGYTSRYLQTLVYTEKISDDILWVLQSDFGTQEDAVFANEQAYWYGLNTYLYWNMTCQLQWGVNLEWFRDDGGFRVGQVLPSFGSPNARGYGPDNTVNTTPSRGSFDTQPGFDGSFYRFMFGPKYYFTPNVYGRASFVADWYDGRRDATTNDQPFNDGENNSQQVLVFDLIATF